MSESQKKRQREQWRKYNETRRAKMILNEAAEPKKLPRGRKIVLRNRSKTVRENQSLRNNVDSLKKGKNKYKSRWWRLKSKADRALDKTPDGQLSPKSTCKKFCRKRKLKDAEAVKKLLDYEILINTIKKNYSIENPSGKKMISKVIKNKYRALGRMSRTGLGLKDRVRLVKERRMKEQATILSIKEFYIRDDNSFLTAGKKETITRQKIKKQKRYLNFTLKELHKKFNDENKMKVSYATFSRYRPFYVLPPHVDDRETCRCKLHENMTLMASRLRQLNIVDNNKPHELVAQIVCDKKKYECMYEQCEKCKGRKLNMEIADESLQISWKIWEAQDKKYRKPSNENETTTKIVTKNNHSGTVKELSENFEFALPKFKTHIFNIANQSQALKMCKEKTAENDFEALMILDFSENYSCKFNGEIQSFHFGGSRAQATLHTSVAYVKGNPISFCTVSDVLDHSPAAIWAHLEPVLKFITEKFPSIKTFHFFSDGPSTQYKQKKNFYLYSKEILNFGFFSSTWNFF